MSLIRSPKDFWSGVLFMVIAIATITIASNYPAGTAARMGPGYFPRALGTVLMTLGALSVLRSFRVPGGGLQRWNWRPIIIVLASVVTFGHIVQFVGLALSTIFLVFASSAASHEFRWKEAAVSGILVAALCSGVFVYGLNIQLPLWPSFG